MEVNFKDLRAAVVDLNKSGLTKKQVTLVGVAKEKIYENFMAAMDKIEDDPKTGEFPKGAEIALNYFNKMVDEEKKDKVEKVEKEKPAKLAKEKAESTKTKKSKKENNNTINFKLISKNTDIKISPQCQIIIDIFVKSKNKPLSYKEIIEEMKKSNIKTKQPMERIFGFYKNLLIKNKIIKVVENETV